VRLSLCHRPPRTSPCELAASAADPPYLPSFPSRPFSLALVLARLQLCHGWSHYLGCVPWMWLLQGKKRVRYAAAWTLGASISSSHFSLRAAKLTSSRLVAPLRRMQSTHSASSLSLSRIPRPLRDETDPPLPRSLPSSIPPSSPALLLSLVPPALLLLQRARRRLGHGRRLLARRVVPRGARGGRVCAPVLPPVPPPRPQDLVQEGLEPQVMRARSLFVYSRGGWRRWRTSAAVHKRRRPTESVAALFSTRSLYLISLALSLPSP